MSHVQDTFVGLEEIQFKDRLRSQSLRDDNCYSEWNVRKVKLMLILVCPWRVRGSHQPRPENCLSTDVGDGLLVSSVAEYPVEGSSQPHRCLVGMWLGC